MKYLLLYLLSNTNGKKTKEKMPKKNSKKIQTNIYLNEKKAEKKISKKTGSSQLSAYMRSYLKNGAKEDYHAPIFCALQKEVQPEKVLYPGCHRHITASLFFPNVHYVDVDAKVGGLYRDKKALDFVADNKAYEGNFSITFSCKNYETDTLEELKSVDLLLSLSAGLVSRSCCKYVKPGGYLFVNDSHSDARVAYFDDHFELVGIYNELFEKFETAQGILAKHFHTVEGEKITEQMVNESIKTPRSKRTFKLAAESMFYLFKKKENLPEEDNKEITDNSASIQSDGNRSASPQSCRF